MSTYAALTDGTTTVTFASPANGGLWYRIESGWGPRVAGLRRSQFGGRGPYDDVTEEIPISVGGSNAAHMYANVSALKGLLDNANRWYRNEDASATVFKYSPEGATISSAASPLQVATWGAELELPSGWPNIPASGGAVWSSGLTMRFTRKGEWLHNTQSASAAGSNGSPVALTFASAASFLCPVDLQATNHYTSLSEYGSFFVVGFGQNAIQQINAGSQGTPGGDVRWSNTSGAAYNAIGGSVARFNPSTSGSGIGSNFRTVTVERGNCYAALVSIKNNSSSITYVFKLGFIFGSESLPLLYTSQVSVPIGGSTSTPAYYNLGVFVAPETGSPSIWYVATPSASASSSWLDVDNIVIYNTLQAGDIKTTAIYQSGAASTATISQNYLTDTVPSVSNSYQMSYSGIAQSLSGASAQVALLATEGSFFRQATGSAASLARSNTWTLTRTNAYLTPV